jgi:hypothetical protein
MHQAIYNRLVELARAGRLTTYSDIAPLAGLSMEREEDRDAISRILVEMLEHEVTNGRPPLTAIVVHRGDDNNPGEGFFAAATELGSYGGSRAQLARLEFWVRAVSEVHRYWGGTNAV